MIQDPLSISAASCLRPDLVSRDTTGTVWRNSGDRKGSFGPRVKIATGWQTYKNLF